MSDNKPDTPPQGASSGLRDYASTPAGDDSRPKDSQADSQPDDSTLDWHGAARSGLPRIPVWLWLLAGVLVISSAFITGLWSAPTDQNGTGNAGDPRNGEPQVAFVAATPTAVSTMIALLPTPTSTVESPPGDATSSLADTGTDGTTAAQPEATGTFDPENAVALADSSPLVLPTVTPTPTPPPVPARVLQVSGQANLRMNIGNSEFQSGGRPIQIPIGARTFRLDEATQKASDQWCIQMGVVNLELALDLTINPASTAVLAQGQAELYNDFCYNQGALIDSTAINLTVPADARIQSTHNMFGERQLLNLSGLLDMDTGVILELEISNLRPRPETSTEAPSPDATPTDATPGEAPTPASTAVPGTLATVTPDTVTPDTVTPDIDAAATE